MRRPTTTRPPSRRRSNAPERSWPRPTRTPFGARYLKALQDHPDVVFAHRDVDRRARLTQFERGGARERAERGDRAADRAATRASARRRARSPISAWVMIVLEAQRAGSRARARRGADIRRSTVDVVLDARRARGRRRRSALPHRRLAVLVVAGRAVERDAGSGRCAATRASRTSSTDGAEPARRARAAVGGRPSVGTRAPRWRGRPSARAPAARAGRARPSSCRGSSA